MVVRHRPSGDLIALKGVVKYPIRIKCAVLAWDVLQEALQDTGEATGAQPQSGYAPIFSARDVRLSQTASSSRKNVDCHSFQAKMR